MNGEKGNIYAIGGKARKMKETTRKFKTCVRIILTWILERWYGIIWTRLTGLKVGAIELLL
jgi:hypothetical protein